MPKPSRKRHPTLAAAWDAYGHNVPWEDLIDIKIGYHGFVALAWEESDGSVNYATLASPDRGATWEMQNDSHEELTRKRWNKARVVPECDWLDVEVE